MENREAHDLNQGKTQLVRSFRKGPEIRVAGGFQKHLTWNKILNKLANSACLIVYVRLKPYFSFKTFMIPLPRKGVFWISI